MPTHYRPASTKPFRVRGRRDATPGPTFGAESESLRALTGGRPLVTDRGSQGTSVDVTSGNRCPMSFLAMSASDLFPAIGCAEMWEPIDRHRGQRASQIERK